MFCAHQEMHTRWAVPTYIYPRAHTSSQVVPEAQWTKSHIEVTLEKNAVAPIPTLVVTTWPTSRFHGYTSTAVPILSSTVAKGTRQTTQAHNAIIVRDMRYSLPTELEHINTTHEMGAHQVEHSPQQDTPEEQQDMDMDRIYLVQDI